MKVQYLLWRCMFEKSTERISQFSGPSDLYSPSLGPRSQKMSIFLYVYWSGSHFSRKKFWPIFLLLNFEGNIFCAKLKHVFLKCLFINHSIHLWNWRWMIPLKLDVFWEQMVDYGVEAKEKRMMFRIRSSNSEFCKSYVYFTSTSSPADKISGRFWRRIKNPETSDTIKWLK